MPGLTQKQKSLQSTARRLSDAILRPHADEVDRSRSFPVENFKALGDAGLLGLTVPAQYGGKGGDTLSLALVAEELGRGCASTAMCWAMHAVGTALISGRATPEQARRWLPAAASGAALATLAFSESGAGVNITRPEITARRASGGYRLTGRKAFVTSGGHATLYPVLVNSPGGNGLSMLIVTPDLPGVRFDGQWAGIGMAGNSSIVMVLDDVLVPEAGLLGREGDGEELLFKVSRPYFYIGLSAVNVGIAQAAFDAALQHALARRNNTERSLVEIPAVQAHLAEMSVAVESARHLVREAARAAAANEMGAGALLMQAKLGATEAARAVAQRAMQVGGGVAYSRALPIERHWRDAQAGVVMSPANDPLKEALGRVLAGLQDG